MGVSPFQHWKDEDWSSNVSEPFEKTCPAKEKSPPRSNPDLNPDPRYFKVLAQQAIGPHLILIVKYPNCANYEGEKILVFLNTDFKVLDKQGFIDPHFSDKKGIYPFARFEPTEDGWKAACAFTQMIYIARSIS